MPVEMQTCLVTRRYNIVVVVVVAVATALDPYLLPYKGPLLL